MKLNFVSLMGRLAGAAFLAAMVWAGPAWGTEIYGDIYGGEYAFPPDTMSTWAYFHDGSTVNFSGNFSYTSSELGFDASTVTLDKDATITVPGELIIRNGTRFEMGIDSKLNVTDTGPGDGSLLIMKDGSTINATGIVSADSYLWGEDWLTVPTTIYSGKASTLLVQGNGVTATINSPYVVFAHRSTVDVGSSTLNITGDTYFFGNGDNKDLVPPFTLTCQGSGCASTYKLTLTDAANGGRINVTGDVTIYEGAKLQVVNYSYLTDNNPYTILDATGYNISGEFNKNPFFLIDYSNDAVQISKGLNPDTVLEEILDEAGVGTTNNYAQAGDLIGRILVSDTSADLKDNLANALQAIYDDPALAETALKQLIGEGALPNLNAHYDTVSMMVSALGRRFQTLHGGLPPAAGNGPNANRLWLGPFGQWNRQKDDSDVYGYDYNAGGIMLGYDREITDGLTLGLYGSLANGSLKNDLVDTDIRTVGLGLYGLYEFGGGFFVDANFGYGRSDSDSTSDTVFGRKTSDFSSDSIQAGLNFGRAFRLGEAATLTPSAGIRYTHVKQDGWAEKGDTADVLCNWFGDSKQNFVEIPLNLKLATTFETKGGAVIAPELRLGGIIAANNPDSEIRMGFVGAPDSAVISGIDPGKSRFVTGAGVKAQLTETVDLFANYDLEFRSGYQGHSASAGLGISF